MKTGSIKFAPQKGKIYKTPEGMILWGGVLLTVALMGLIIWFALTDPPRAGNLLLAFAAHIFGGRAAGIGLCFMAGFNLVWTLLYNFYLEILIVCLAYSVFILSMSNHIKFKWVMQISVAMKNKAEKHKDKIEKYGWIGLFLFVMVPLPVTGPVTGSIMGYLLNIHVGRNFSAVFLGTFAAIFFWVIFFDFLEQHVHVIQYVIIGIVLIVLFSHLKTIKRWLQ
ncbi:Putative small multi-drug export protein [Desulfocicer vacuolatum DSM 3385]|uniref:Putative small multi-drug export protein n=1 Tax=Desulfocicer vacuolatum DSM 3385 TaxID=1121400 RepID=A0A1W2DWI2_9BACT|nr:small multi-drug export protein [Desulfocicer vacuolatum]SMD01881.1 Putative small multi-drug export protein [Desulfocicer vacuolatum DSM 3385]